MSCCLRLYRQIAIFWWAQLYFQKMKEENEMPKTNTLKSHTIPIEPPQIEITLREIISAICTNDMQDIQQLMMGLKDISLDKITLQEIIAYQLMPKVNFAELHLHGNEWTAGIIRQKKQRLTQIWKRELRDPSKIRSSYEK